jgi:hypothetical protein
MKGFLLSMLLALTISFSLAQAALPTSESAQPVKTDSIVTKVNNNRFIISLGPTGSGLGFGHFKSASANHKEGFLVIEYCSWSNTAEFMGDDYYENYMFSLLYDYNRFWKGWPSGFYYAINAGVSFIYRIKHHSEYVYPQGQLVDFSEKDSYPFPVLTAGIGYSIRFSRTSSLRLCLDGGLKVMPVNLKLVFVF